MEQVPLGPRTSMPNKSKDRQTTAIQNDFPNLMPNVGSSSPVRSPASTGVQAAPRSPKASNPRLNHIVSLKLSCKVHFVAQLNLSIPDTTLIPPVVTNNELDEESLQLGEPIQLTKKFDSLLSDDQYEPC